MLSSDTRPKGIGSIAPSLTRRELERAGARTGGGRRVGAFRSPSRSPPRGRRAGWRPDRLELETDAGIGAATATRIDRCPRAEHDAAVAGAGGEAERERLLAAIGGKAEADHA